MNPPKRRRRWTRAEAMLEGRWGTRMGPHICDHVCKLLVEMERVDKFTAVMMDISSSVGKNDIRYCNQGQRLPGHQPVVRLGQFEFMTYHDEETGGSVELASIEVEWLDGTRSWIPCRTLRRDCPDQYIQHTLIWGVNGIRQAALGTIVTFF